MVQSTTVLRRGLSLTLIAILAVQLLGAVAFASVCFEPCPDDTEESSCPPVCATCTTCTHSRQAIVQTSAAGIPVASGRHSFLPQAAMPTSAIAADIFHVPLPG